MNTMATSVPSSSISPKDALVYDVHGSPLEVLSLCPQPAIDERDMGPKDIIVDFMLVRVGDANCT